MPFLKCNNLQSLICKKEAVSTLPLSLHLIRVISQCYFSLSSDDFEYFGIAEEFDLKGFGIETSKESFNHSISTLLFH